MVLSLTSNLSAILGAEIQMRASLLLVVLMVMGSSGWTAHKKSRAPEGGGFLVGEDVEGVLRRKTAPGSLRARDLEG
jgi:hypothetical protein